MDRWITVPVRICRQRSTCGECKDRRTKSTCYIQITFRSAEGPCEPHSQQSRRAALLHWWSIEQKASDNRHQELGAFSLLRLLHINLSSHFATVSPRIRRFSKMSDDGSEKADAAPFYQGFESICLHGGYVPDATTSRGIPLYRTAPYQVRMQDIKRGRSMMMKVSFLLSSFDPSFLIFLF